MKRDVRVYLQDMLESIDKINTYSKGLSKEKFDQDTKVQDAILRRLEILGEAVKSIPEEIRIKYPEIPWKKVAGVRDVLIHGYFGVNLERVWEILQKDLGELKSQLLKVQKDLEKQS